MGMPGLENAIMRKAFISDKRRIMQEMQQAQQHQAQAQQAEAQAHHQSDNADIMVKFAKSRSELAKEKELMASAQEKITNIQQIQAKAEHERTEADLNLVKIMMELEDMQFGQFKAALEYAQALKEPSLSMQSGWYMRSKTYKDKGFSKSKAALQTRKPEKFEYTKKNKSFLKPKRLAKGG